MRTDTANVLLAIENVAAVRRFAACLAPPHDVRIVASVDDAIDALGTGWDVDVLFLSSLLPGYGADAVLREVRYRNLDCRVVMVDDDSGIERVEDGVDARIAAPFDATAVRGVVGALATPVPSGPGRDPAANVRSGGEAS